MQPGKNLHLPDNWHYKIYLQLIAFLVPTGPIKGLLNFNSYSQGQLFLTIKL